jgi:hypothetical protein
MVYPVPCMLIVEVVEAEFPAYLSLEEVYHEVHDFKAPGARQTAAEERSLSPESDIAPLEPILDQLPDTQESANPFYNGSFINPEDLTLDDQDQDDDSTPIPTMDPPNLIQSNNAARQALAIIQAGNQPSKTNVKTVNKTPATPQHFNKFVKRPLESDLEDDAAVSPYRQVPRTSNKKIKSEPVLDAAKEERDLKHEEAMAKIALEELRLKVRDGQLKHEAEARRSEAHNASQMMGMLGDIIKALVPTVAANNTFATVPHSEPVAEPDRED